MERYLCTQGHIIFSFSLGAITLDLQKGNLVDTLHTSFPVALIYRVPPGISKNWYETFLGGRGTDACEPSLFSFRLRFTLFRRSYRLPRERCLMGNVSFAEELSGNVPHCPSVIPICTMW